MCLLLPLRGWPHWLSDDNPGFHFTKFHTKGILAWLIITLKQWRWVSKYRYIFPFLNGSCIKCRQSDTQLLDDFKDIHCWNSLIIYKFPCDFQESSVPHIVSSVIGELACLSVDRHVSVFTDFQHATTLAYGKKIQSNVHVSHSVLWSLHRCGCYFKDTCWSCTVISTQMLSLRSWPLVLMAR